MSDPNLSTYGDGCNEADSPKMIRVDVSGKDPRLFAKLRRTLIQSFNRVLDLSIDRTQGTTVNDELKDIASAAFDAAKAKLAMPVVQVEEIQANIEKTYAEARVALTIARKQGAEAHAQVIDNELKQLRLSLAATKAMLVGESGEEAILLGKQIDEFVRMLKELNLV